MNPLKIRLPAIAVLVLILSGVSFANPTVQSASETISQIHISSSATSETFQNALANALVSSQPVSSNEESSGIGVVPAPEDTSNNPSKQASSDAFVNLDYNGVEAKPISFESPLADFFDSNISSDANALGPLADSSDNSCSSTSSNQLGEYYYKSYIDYGGDVDWYYGYKAQSFFLRVIMIPPVGKDYDIEIWDSCNSFVKRCNAGTGSTEVCSAGVTGDFYVKVSGFNSAYSSNAPYFIVAGYDAACTAIGENGNPTKSSYACNETVQAQNQRFTNNNSSTISYHYFDFLHYPSTNFANETQYLDSSLPSNYTANWTSAGYTPSSSGWAEAGTYTLKSTIMAFCSNGGVASANAFAYPYVPAAPCIVPGTIIGYNGDPTKSSFACSENIVTQNHKFENTSNTYTFNYTFYYELKDPGNNVIVSGSTPNNSLPPNTYANWALEFPPGSSGWPASGTYNVRSWVSGTFTDGRNQTAYSYAALSVPTAPCPNCSLSSQDGAPTKSSFKSYETIVTENHGFTNTGNQKFTYDLSTQLFDSSGTLISSGTETGKVLDAGYNTSWSVTSPPSVGGWEKTGTYTMKVTAAGTCANGTPKTLYSFGYPVVDPTCSMVSSSAWVEQQNLCSESIIAKHEFLNNGTRTLPYNANFYLYDPSGNQVGTTSNSYSASPHMYNIWTVTWGVPSGGWKAGTYRAEAQLSGNCTGGGSASASNSANASMPSSCNVTSCSGSIGVSVKDNSSNGIGGAKVYLDGSYRADTDSSGANSQPTSDVSCGQRHSIAIYCSNGTYCDTKSTAIDYSGDNDALAFTCQVCVQSKSLKVSVSSNSSYGLNDPINIEITVKDNLSNPVDGATLSIYNPFTNSTQTRTTSGGGKHVYTTTASKTGTSTFTITATKSTYTSASATRSVAVNQNLATIAVDVDTIDGSPLQGAYIFVDGASEGQTNSGGKKDITTTTGNHHLDVKCPDSVLCSSTNVYASGTTNISFDCACDIDADGDGLKNSEEALIGSDPKDISSNLTTVLESNDVSCLKLITGHIGPFSEPQKERLIGNLAAMNHERLVSVASRDMGAVSEALDGTGVSPASMQTSTLTLQEFFAETKGTEAYEASDGTVIVLSARGNGYFDLTNIGANCQGFFIGLPNGAFGGIRDDVLAIIGIPGVAGQVLSGMWWAFSHPKELPGVVESVGSFIFKGGLLDAFNGLVKEATVGIFKEGKNWNVYESGTAKYTSFQLGFLDGYISGYVVEQVAAFAVGAGEVAKIIKGINVGGEFAKLGEKAYLAFTRIGEKFGGGVAEALKAFRAPVFTWASTSAQDFAARAPKLFAKTSDADNWLVLLGSKAEGVAAKGERVMQKLITELGSEELAEKAMSKLLSSEFGKKALTEWTSEDAVKQYAKMYEKYGAQTMGERFSINFSIEEIEPVMSNLDELSKIPNLQGYNTFESNIARSAKSDGPGLFYEATQDVAIKNKGYQLISVNEKIEGGQIDNVAKELSSGKKYATEIKSGNLSNDKGIWGQLDRLKNYVDQGKADKARLISRQAIPEDVKKYAQERGIEIIEGGI